MTIKNSSDMRIMILLSSAKRRCRRYQAPTPRITNAVVITNAVTVCTSRYGSEGVKITSSMPVGKKRPSMIW